MLHDTDSDRKMIISGKTENERIFVDDSFLPYPVRHAILRNYVLLKMLFLKNIYFN